jgi:hypothetical protein
LEPLTFQTDIFKQLPCNFNPSLCIHITFQVMTVAFQSTSYQCAISAFFEGAK